MSVAAFVDVGAFASPAGQLAAELELLDLRLHRQVLRLRAAHRLTEDQFRGLYIPDEEVDALLAKQPDETGAAELTWRIAALREQLDLRAAERDDLPLTRIAARYGRFAAELLVVAAATGIDLRYQTLFAYAQNDVTRKSPTVDLVLQLLCDGEAARIAARDAFRPDAPLLADHLIQLADDPHDVAPPLLSRYVRTDTRVVDHLLGRNALDVALLRIARHAPPANLHELHLDPVVRGQLDHILNGLSAAMTTLVLEGAPRSGRTTLASAVAGALGLPLLVVDGAQLTPEQFPLVRREALLSGSAVAVREPSDPAAVLHELRDLPAPLFLLSSATGTSVSAFRITLPPPGYPARRLLWREALTAAGRQAGDSAIDETAGKFVLTPGRIHDAARTAAAVAAMRGETTTLAHRDLAFGAHAQSTHNLRKLAQHVETRHEWSDIVLPPRLVRQLREICRYLQFRHVVYSDWGLERRLAGAKGLVALFSGPSGTGKTMAASVLARELDLELYRIDLAAVVSKYIGETEKNLGAIFDEARSSNAVLFFDEADALFGKRSEVKDAHDRYANIETAYLLQRIEDHDGLVVLATNLPRNLDEAFARRIHHALEFPLPDPSLREKIWRGLLPSTAPVADDVDFPFLARQLELSGGNIRNVVLAAAFAAAAESRPIAMPDFIAAAARELRKIGRLPGRAEFGEYYDIVCEERL